MMARRSVRTAILSSSSLSSDIITRLLHPHHPQLQLANRRLEADLGSKPVQSARCLRQDRQKPLYRRPRCKTRFRQAAVAQNPKKVVLVNQSFCAMAYLRASLDAVRALSLIIVIERRGTFALGDYSERIFDGCRDLLAVGPVHPDHTLFHSAIGLDHKLNFLFSGHIDSPLH